MDMKALYETDDRFRRYVDCVANDEGRTPEEVMQEKTVIMVGEYYAENKPNEKPVTEEINVGCGGC